MKLKETVEDIEKYLKDNIQNIGIRHVSQDGKRLYCSFRNTVQFIIQDHLYLVINDQLYWLSDTELYHLIVSVNKRRLREVTLINFATALRETEDGDPIFPSSLD